MNSAPECFLQRKKPASHRCFDEHNQPVVSITVCTKHKRRLLASARIHEHLQRLWLDRSHWIVGRYVIMPDHIHLLVRVGSRNACWLARWVRWWKRELSKTMGWKEGYAWQSGCWDTHVFVSEAYSDKLRYVRENPVRAGLVVASEQWPYQGEIYTLGRLD